MFAVRVRGRCWRKTQTLASTTRGSRSKAPASITRTPACCHQQHWPPGINSRAFCWSSNVQEPRLNAPLVCACATGESIRMRSLVRGRGRLASHRPSGVYSKLLLCTAILCWIFFCALSHHHAKKTLMCKFERDHLDRMPRFEREAPRVFFVSVVCSSFLGPLRS